MKKILLLIVILFISGCVENVNYEVEQPLRIDGEVIVNGQTFQVQLAEDKIDKIKGLMHREEMCNNCGMLFVFEEEALRTFWMKNTLIPLDMVFINSDLEIVDVKYAEPCVEDPCERYTAYAKYVLEVNGGKFNNSIVGSKVSSSLFTKTIKETVAKSTGKFELDPVQGMIA